MAERYKSKKLRDGNAYYVKLISETQLKEDQPKTLTN